MLPVSADVSDPLIATTLPVWDINQDGIVDISDLLQVTAHFWEEITTPPEHNPDVNGDGKVNLLDLILVARNVGTKPITVYVEDPLAKQGIANVQVQVFDESSKEIITAGHTDAEGYVSLYLPTDKPCVISVKDEKSPEIGKYFDIEISIDDIRPGQTLTFQMVPDLGIQNPVLRERFTTFLEMLKYVTNNYGAIRRPEDVIGPTDTLLQRWRGHVVFLVQYPDKIIPLAQGILDELRKKTELDFSVFYHTAGGTVGKDHIRFGTSDNNLEAISLHSNGCPQYIRIKTDYARRNDLQFVRAVRKDMLRALLVTRNTSSEFVTSTEFSSDAINLINVVYSLPVNYDLSAALNETNSAPLVILPKTMEGAETNAPFNLAANFYDPDGDRISWSWEELVATKTTLDYWNGARLDVQNADSVEASVVREWPGPRRFRVTATDQHGASRSETIDIMFYRDRPLDYKKAITLHGTGWPPDYNVDLEATIERWLDNGADAFVLIPWYAIHDRHSTNIYPEYGIATHPENGKQLRVTLTDQEYRDIINQIVSRAEIRGREVDIMFKPHVRILNSPDYSDDFYYIWQGTLTPENGDWDSLFDSFENFVVHYCKLAQEINDEYGKQLVKYICVGTELHSMLLPSWRNFGVPDPDPRWRKIIRACREAYDGSLTISVSSNHNNPERASQVMFWDSLDYIGFEPYVNLTGSHVGTEYKIDPTIDELVQGMSHVVENYIAPLTEEFGKEVIITEANWRSFDGSNMDPLGNWGGGNREEIDFQENASCMNVLLDRLDRSGVVILFTYWPGWLKGGSLSQVNVDWDDFYQPDNVSCYDGFPYGKPIEAIIRANWNNPP